MRMQTLITIVTGVLTVVYIVLAAGQVDWATVSALPAGSVEQLIGALVFLMTGFGLGWVNVAADYSRYLPRNASVGRRRRLDDVRGLDRPGRAAGVRAAARRLVARPVHAPSPPTRSARSPPSADLVPRAVRAGGGARAGRRRGARHLLLRARAALARAAHPALVGGAGRRRDHGARDDLRRLLRRRLPRPVPGLPLHARRAGRGLGRDHARRRGAAPPRLRRTRALRADRPLRRRPLGGGGTRRRGHGPGLGPGDQRQRGRG